MKKLYFILISSYLLSLNVLAQTSFPLEFGNKWYYKSGSTRHEYFHFVKKEVTNELSNGFKEITAQYFYSDSITTKKEYWAYINNKFYMNVVPETTFSPIIYNTTLTKDSCVSNGPLHTCIYLRSYQIFNVLDTAQEYSELYVGHGFSSAQKIVVFPNLGIITTWTSSGSPSSTRTEDSTYLIGMYRNGELLGDTTFIIPKDDTTYFNLNVGRKWYYQISLPYDYNNFYETVVREVKDILDNGFREIEATYYFMDSLIIKEEYWAFQNNKFYISDLPDFDSAFVCYDPSLQGSHCVYKNSAEYCLGWSKYFFNDQEYPAQNFSYVLGTANGSIQKYYSVVNTLGPVKIMYNTNMGSYYTIENLIEINIDSTDSTASLLPTVIELSQNYPNPFNPTTRIKYAVVNSGIVNLKVYDILGNEVATLVNEERQPGSYIVEFKPTNRGRQLACGIYFYQFSAGDFIQTKKMIYKK